MSRATGCPQRRGGATGPPALSYCKVCNVEDFAHPALVPVIREVFEHEIDRFGPDFPAGREYRKYWEIAMAVRAFGDHGLLDGDADLLGVGAGNEPTCFYLTGHARRVHATDLYLGESAWDTTGISSMLVAPEQHWPFDWNPRRLVVQHMNALELRYEDESFDGIFSSSSIEHFGDYDAVDRAVAEMYRVLRPGGVLSVSTEYLLAGPTAGWTGTLMFRAQELYEHLLGSRDWLPLSPVDLFVSDATLATELDFDEVLEDQTRQVERYGGHFSFRIEYDRYPHVVLRQGEYLWTSVHVAMRKIDRRSAT